MNRALLAACVLLGACEAPTVPERLLRDVYEFRLVTPSKQVMRWPIGTTVKVFVVADADATRTQWLRSGVTNAIPLWNSAALYGEVQLAEASSIQEADVVVEYNTTSSPLDLGACQPSGGFAYTTFCLASGGEHLTTFAIKDGSASHVKFVVTVRTTSATDELTVQRLVAHELGHTLGLAQHSPKQTDLMWGGTTLSRDDPSPADRATLQVLYHTVPDITP